MSKMDELIASINPKRKSPSKDKLWEFIKESLQEVSQINDAYKRYFESPAGTDAPSIFQDIEAKVQKIKQSYSDLFAQGPDGSSKISALETKVEDIKQYHADLLEGDESVKSDIDAAQEKITEFYEYLFGEDGESGVEPDVREAIDTILKSKKTITDFEEHINENIKPNLKEVQDDISVKRREVNALLSQATANTLAQAYAESKHEYSIPAPKSYEGGGWLKNIEVFFFNSVGRYVGFLFNYALFVLPLVSISLIFINEDVARIVLESLSQRNVVPSPMELIYVKTVISIPLLWIAWYGQRNIVQRKRLTEEYNHKLRVVQMYLMFITDETSYHLKDKAALEEALLKVIKRNPSEVYGRDETILDKIADVFRAKRQKVDDVAEEITESSSSKEA